MSENIDTSQQSALNRFLNFIERAGNKLPHITVLYLCPYHCAYSSFALSYINFDYVHPKTGEKIAILNMLAPELSILWSSQCQTSWPSLLLALPLWPHWVLVLQRTFLV